MGNSKSGHANIHEDRDDKSEKSRMIVKIRPRVRIKKKSRVRVMEKKPTQARVQRVTSINPPPTSSRDSVKETPSNEEYFSTKINSLEED